VSRRVDLQQRVTVSGTLVSISADRYEAFQDRSGNMQPAGVSRRAWVLESDSVAPWEIKISEAWAAALQGSKSKKVELECAVGRRGVLYLPEQEISGDRDE